MKKLIFLLSILFSFTTIYGQFISVNTDKTEYKVGEPIIITYQVNLPVDSTDKLIEKGFKIIRGPFTKSSTSTVDGSKRVTYSVTYELKALSPGKLKIVSPVFYINSLTHKANEVILEIVSNKLSAEEIDEINFNKFKNKQSLPNGMIRIVISEDYGYIEEFNNLEWTFKRRLTVKEITKIKKVNNH